MKIKKICLGPEGSFSENAMKIALKELGLSLEGENGENIQVENNAQVIPTFSKTNGYGAVACLAVHTRQQGRLTGSFEDMIALFEDSEAIILGALDMPVSFSLMVRDGVTEPQGIISHQRGIGACKKLVEGIGKPVKAVGSNPLAAKMVASDPEYAFYGALAPAECAELYGLKILKDKCETSPAWTMFYIFGRNIIPQIEKIKNEWRAVVIFDAKDAPLALVRALLSFGLFGINMVHLVSVFSEEGKYRFIAEVEGNRKKIKWFSVAKFFLKLSTKKCRIFGPFPVLSGGNK